VLLKAQNAVITSAASPTICELKIHVSVWPLSTLQQQQQQQEEERVRPFRVATVTAVAAASCCDAAAAMLRNKQGCSQTAAKHASTCSLQLAHLAQQAGLSHCIA
jgi:hypothetical protein